MFVYSPNNQSFHCFIFFIHRFLFFFFCFFLFCFFFLYISTFLLDCNFRYNREGCKLVQGELISFMHSFIRTCVCKILTNVFSKTTKPNNLWGWVLVIERQKWMFCYFVFQIKVVDWPLKGNIKDTFLYILWGNCWKFKLNGITSTLRKHAFSSILEILQPKKKIFRKRKFFIFLLKT